MSWLIETYLDEEYNILDEDYGYYDEADNYKSNYDLYSEALEDILNEGANIDNTKTFLKGRKEFTQEFRLAKKLYKSGDLKESKQHFKKATKAIDDMESAIRDTKGNAGSAILGLFANGLINFGMEIIPIGGILLSGAGIKKNVLSIFSKGGIKDAEDIAELADGLLDALIDSEKECKKIVGSAIFGTVSYIFLFIENIVLIVKDIAGIVKELKNPKTDTADAWNLYRNRLLRYINKYKTSLARLENKIYK